MTEAKVLDANHFVIRSRGTVNNGSSTGNEYERSYSAITIGY